MAYATQGATGLSKYVSMEAAGAGRSLSYVDFVGDGDSSSHREVVCSNPYGDVEEQKIECVDHIQKRMGRRFRKKADFRSANPSDGKTIGDRNRLTNNLLDRDIWKGFEGEQR